MKTYLDLEEIDLVEKAAANLRDHLLIRMLSRLGCRITEALSLSVEDINLESGLVTIQHLKTKLHVSCSKCGNALGRSTVYCPKYGIKVAATIIKELEHRRKRNVPIDKETLKLLEEYYNRGGPVDRNGKKLIFGINRHRAWQIIKDCSDKAGFSEITNPESGRVHHVSPHQFRTAFAVNAMKTNDSGDGLRLLQEHLGHASFNTTAKYRKVSGHEQRHWYDNLWNKDQS
jgi:integrase/recombinase XerD